VQTKGARRTDPLSGRVPAWSFRTVTFRFVAQPLFVDETTPTARALLVLEMVQNSPGIRGEQLADRLGMTDRAVRRYVGNLRDAGISVESTRGRYGGYRIGRGVRLAPLMFTAPEALGLVMAVLEGRAHDPTDPVGQAVGKIIRVLPHAVAEPVEAVVRMSERTPDGHSSAPDPQVTAALVQGCAARHRLRLNYALRPGRLVDMDVDPWALVVRFGKWYLLGWSHTADARRILRVDRVAGVEELAEAFEPPEDLDPVTAIEEHLADGWRHKIEVVVEAPVLDVRCWIPRKQGLCEAIDEHTTRIRASTDELDWYAERLASVRARFRVVSPPELRDEVAAVGRRMLLSSTA
jgi:predicted DNA-binding transcriptional regulator YafY